MIGTASLTAPGQYQINWTNAPFGDHLLVALATDNLGKKRASKPVRIIANGPIAIRIISPTNGTSINKPANITVKANATIAVGSITKVDFYGDGSLLGTGTLAGPNEDQVDAGGGSISGSMVTSPAGSIDLTAAGIIDWAHWGRNGPSTFDHKAGVTPQKNQRRHQDWQWYKRTTSWTVATGTRFGDGVPRRRSKSPS